MLDFKHKSGLWASGPMSVLVTLLKIQEPHEEDMHLSLVWYGTIDTIVGVNIFSIYLDVWVEGHLGQNQNPLVTTKTTPRKLLSHMGVSGSQPVCAMLSAC